MFLFVLVMIMNSGANSGPPTIHLFRAARFSVSPTTPSLFDPNIFRFMGMIQRNGRKAFLCLVNYKRIIAEFCMCVAHLDACMEARTCLVDVQPIRISAYMYKHLFCHEACAI